MDNFIVVILVLLSGLFSGLTIGLSSLSKEDLERLQSLGDIKAAKVLSVVKDYNLLLVTLLLGNTVVNALLTDFLGSVVGTGFFAVAVATALILIFGEITPGAVLSRHALSFGAKVTPLIKGLILLFYPIAKPISWILNKLLGKDLKSIYTRDDFEYMLDKHTAHESNIDELDNTLIKGTLSLNETVAGEITTKRRNVYSLKYDTVITPELIDEISEKNYSRIPVINDNQVIGILKAKYLLNFPYDENEPVEVMEYTDSGLVLKFEDSDRVDDILEDMLEARIHIATINNSKNMWVGILTMEDILKKLFNKEDICEEDEGPEEDEEYQGN